MDNIETINKIFALYYERDKETQQEKKIIWSIKMNMIFYVRKHTMRFQKLKKRLK